MDYPTMSPLATFPEHSALATSSLAGLEALIATSDDPCAALMSHYLLKVVESLKVMDDLVRDHRIDLIRQGYTES